MCDVNFIFNPFSSCSGHSNRGLSPKLILLKIRAVLGYSPSMQDKDKDEVYHTSENLLGEKHLRGNSVAPLTHRTDSSCVLVTKSQVPTDPRDLPRGHSNMSVIEHCIGPHSTQYSVITMQLSISTAISC